jgi:hypothetical protein
VGRGPERTIVDAGGDGGVNDRVVDVHAPGERLTLRGLTVTGGSPDLGTGGGIRALEGSLRLESCVVSGNELFGSSGMAVNSASTIPGDLTEVVDSWITGNAGEYSVLETEIARIERTTVSDNTQTQYASTVEIHGLGSLLLDSTFGGNTAAQYSPLVAIWGGAVAIEGCTLVGVDAALYVTSSGSATLSNTLISGWCAGEGQVTSLGGNLESPGATCELGADDFENVPDPGLSALGFFGGPAPVYRPLAGSPAVDVAIATPGCPALDQRGLPRPQDGDGDGNAICDIGAVEIAGAGELFVETFECGFTTPWSDMVP